MLLLLHVTGLKILIPHLPAQINPSYNDWDYKKLCMFTEVTYNFVLSDRKWRVRWIEGGAYKRIVPFYCINQLIY